jgi:fructose transport system permease protein
MTQPTTTITEEKADALEANEGRDRNLIHDILTHQVTGPLAALIVAGIIFSVTTNTFLNAGNVSLVLQQAMVIGALGLGQTLIILTAGIDLSDGAIMVLGSVVIGKIAMNNDPVLALFLGLLVCVALGVVNGSLISKLGLPPFIVTLGGFTAITAAAQLFTHSATYPIESSLIKGTGGGPGIGGFTITYGVMLWIGMTIILGYALSQTAWGTRVYAVGNNPQAAKLNGIKVRRVLFSVYIVATVIYGFSAWISLGRTPSADPSAYAAANLESITAVVIGGTSLFGGRGSVHGTVIGALIVATLQNGLTQAGIDSLYQEVATGALVIVAVGIDQILRKRQSR